MPPPRCWRAGAARDVAPPIDCVRLGDARALASGDAGASRGDGGGAADAAGRDPGLIGNAGPGQAGRDRDPAPRQPGTLFKRTGSGQIQRDAAGVPAIYGGNFLIRTRHAFAAAGFLVFSVDVPSDHLGGVDPFRGTAEHAQDIAAVIAYARQQASVPVWLVGTSMGTISAANAGARLKTGGPDGLVLTSSMTAATKHNVSVAVAVDVGAITIPTLFVHNKEDGCVAATFGGVASLMDKFKGSPRKELIAVSGGSPPQSDPCQAFSRHGYLGIEDEVVGDIARWIKSGR